MPTYKTHSIHIDKSSDYIDSRIELDKEDLKVFSFGPDVFALTDSNTFNTQHNKDSRYFFECLLNNIKTEKALDNKELIGFLYGELSHFIVDATFHPYIYYLTENMKSTGIINPHLQMELLLDSYFMKKYGVSSKDYYSKTGIRDLKAREVIDRVYSYIFNCLKASSKFDIGLNAILLFENAVRSNKTLATICSFIGDFEYHDKDVYSPFLNANRSGWLDPITGEEHEESINELWNQSVGNFIEAVDDVNRFLYDDKPLKNRFITNNLSYDTAQHCDVPKKLIYTKRY